MHPRDRVTHHPRPGRRRRGAALAATLASTLASTLAATVVGGPLALPAQAAEGSDPDVTLVQANIKTGTETFEADVATVMAQRPDLVTYNEVPYRSAATLAPAGYSIHRSVANRYTAATPVVWKHPEWTKVDAGTFRISNVREIPDGKHTRLGLRFANWATLRSTEGRVLSVVSVHVAPLFKLDGQWVDLIRPSVRQLGKLVAQLAPAGPVLVGGDFNVHYKSGRYPRDLFAEAGLVPTYDTMGGYFGTGDHGGHTIDYVFNRGAGELAVTSHGRRELHSDHDAVIAGLDWQVDAPAETIEIVSDPQGTEEERLAVLRAMAGSIADAEPGETVDVVTGQLGKRMLMRRMKGAVARGVDVRLLTRSTSLTTFERRFGRYVADEAGSSLTRCRSACQDRWRESGMARTFALVRQAGGDPTLRVDANRSLIKALPERRTRLLLKSGDVELAEGERMLAEVR